MDLMSRIKWGVLLLIMSQLSYSYAQEGAVNPFELPNKEQKGQGLNEEEDAQEQGNPFELNRKVKTEKRISLKEERRNPFELVAPSKETVQKKKNTEKKKLLKVIPDENKKSDWLIFVMLLIILAYAAFLSTLSFGHIRKTINAFMRYNMSNLMFREQQGEVVSWKSILIYVLYVFVVGAFLYLALGLFEIDLGIQSPPLRLLLCIGLVGFEALFRHLVLSFIALIFPFKKEMGHYNFTIGVFNQIIGIVLIPSFIFMAFGPENLRVYGFWAGIGTLALIFSFRAIRGLFIAEKYISVHKFHFLLYLCTVEIAPIIVLIKFCLL